MEAKRVLDSILQETAALKEDCLNRNDPQFAVWHRRLGEAIRQFAPFKVPAFEEIRFASDFFLSKDSGESASINDRIALVCDIDEATTLVRAVLHHLEKQTPPVKKNRTLAASPVELAPAGSLGTATDLLHLAEPFLSDLSERERAEFQEEVAGLQREMDRETPDWDVLRRKMKYLIDFGREPALKILPYVLQRLNDAG